MGWAGPSQFQPPQLLPSLSGCREIASFASQANCCWPSCSDSTCLPWWSRAWLCSFLATFKNTLFKIIRSSSCLWPDKGLYRSQVRKWMLALLLRNTLTSSCSYKDFKQLPSCNAPCLLLKTAYFQHWEVRQINFMHMNTKLPSLQVGIPNLVMHIFFFKILQ